MLDLRQRPWRGCVLKRAGDERPPSDASTSSAVCCAASARRRRRTGGADADHRAPPRAQGQGVRPRAPRGARALGRAHRREPLQAQARGPVARPLPAARRRRRPHGRERAGPRAVRRELAAPPRARPRRLRGLRRRDAPRPRRPLRLAPLVRTNDPRRRADGERRLGPLRHEPLHRDLPGRLRLLAGRSDVRVLRDEDRSEIEWRSVESIIEVAEVALAENLSPRSPSAAGRASPRTRALVTRPTRSRPSRSGST